MHGNVFFAHEPRMMRDPETGVRRPRDLSSANRYGTIRFVFNRDEHPSLTPSESLVQAQKVLANFDPHNDYVCYAGGDPLSIAITFLALKALRIHTVQFLRYDRERGRDGGSSGHGFYVPVTVNLNAS